MTRDLLTSTSKGSKENNRDALLAENKQLRRQLEQTKKRLAKTELIIELQKKLSAIMGIDDPTNTGRSDAE